MFKKSLLVVLTCFMVVQTLAAPRRRFSFTSPAEVGHVPDHLTGVESTRRRDHDKMAAYLRENSASVKERFALPFDRAWASGFKARLQALAGDPAVKSVLDARVALNAPVVATREDLMAWGRYFDDVVKSHGAQVISNDGRTLTFRFSDMPEFSILASVRGWPFAAYDSHAGERLGFNCNFWCTPDCEFSPYYFPLHLISRVLYADEINCLGFPNVRAAGHWIFNFGEEGAALDDADVFVVVENTPIDEAADSATGEALRVEYAGWTVEQLKDLADSTDTSLMANIVRAIRRSGIYTVKPGIKDPRFITTADGTLCAIFCNVERPSTGKPAFWFHDCEGSRPDGVVTDEDGNISKEEIRRDADCGLGELANWLSSAAAASDA